MTTFDELYNQRIDEGLEREATARPVAETNNYNVQINRMDEQEGDDPGRTWNFGKKYFWCTAPIHRDGLGQGPIVGNVSFNASPIRYTDETTGKLEWISLNWGKLTSALRKADAIGPDATVADVLEAAKQYPIRVRVLRQYHTGERWEAVDPGDGEKEKGFRENGYDVRNSTVNIMQYQDG